MNPVLEKASELGDVYQFTLSNANVSLVNAVRRTILSDIPTICFCAEAATENSSNIEVNTTRFHNEILKHRLNCIPIHEKDPELLLGKYVLEVDVKNDTDTIVVVTTEDFKIKNKVNNNYLTKEETRRMFPLHPISQQYIDFVRLRPKISDTIPGEHIKLTAEFFVRTSKDNSVYNVVSKCSYSNTKDVVKSEDVWSSHESKLMTEGMSKDEIEFQKKNFELLDAQRYFKEDSFDFVVQTIGVYSNKDLVKKACSVIYDKLATLVLDIDSDSVPINHSETTMEFCYDITLLNEDYTIGKIIEFIIYEKYYKQENILAFCGFKKYHPHDKDSIIRLAYVENVDKRMVAQHLRIACNDAIDVFKRIYKMF